MKILSSKGSGKYRGKLLSLKFFYLGSIKLCKDSGICHHNTLYLRKRPSKTYFGLQIIMTTNNNNRKTAMLSCVQMTKIKNGSHCVEKGLIREALLFPFCLISGIINQTRRKKISSKVQHNTHERKAQRLTSPLTVTSKFSILCEKLGPTIFKAADTPLLPLWHECERREQLIHALFMVLEYIP